MAGHRQDRRPSRVTVVFVGLGLMAGVGSLSSQAAGTESAIDFWAPKAIVIVRSTSSFAEAEAIAAEVARRLDLEMDLRGLSPVQPSGLTFPPSVCAENGYSYPCYVARGRYDDGVYTSVEYSDAYSGFRRGLYFVVVASGAPDDPAVRDALSRAKDAYPDAYHKVATVYMGCIH